MKARNWVRPTPGGSFQKPAYFPEKKMNWIRARSSQQIRQRVDEILSATASLYEKFRFEEITFALIAKEAGFTRSNLYRYFETKEDIFLELLQSDISAWRGEVCERFGDEPLSAGSFAQTWVDLLLKHPRMLRLFAILYPLLEPNASLEALTEFKKAMLAEMDLIGEKLGRVYAFATPEAVSEFISVQTALAIGAFPMINLTEKQKEAMQQAGMPMDEAYFRGVLQHAVEMLLLGLGK